VALAAAAVAVEEFLVAKLVFFSLLLNILFVGHAQAFTLGSSTNSDMRGWSSSTVTFKINNTNCPPQFDMDTIFDDAARVWNNVPNSKLHLARSGGTSGTSKSNPPTIWCSTTFGTDSGANANFVAGVGSFNLTSGVISSGHVILNVQSGANANISNLDSESLKVLLAHEIGHVLGFGHSEYGEALMYYSLSQSRLTLHQDDMDAVAYLYPRNEFDTDQPMGCGTVSNIKPQGPTRMIWTLFALLLPLLAWLIARKKVKTIK
jgi:hypothetical protein